MIHCTNSIHQIYGNEEVPQRTWHTGFAVRSLLISEDTLYVTGSKLLVRVPSLMHVFAYALY